MSSTVKRFIRAAAIGATLALAPVAYSPSEGLRENTAACQNGTCCREADAICGLNGVNIYHYYYRAEGPCTQIKPNTPG